MATFYARSLGWITCTLFGLVLHSFGLAQGRSSERTVAATVTRTVSDSNGASTKLALVIGNSAYKPLTALTNPAHDAQDVCDALTALGFDSSCYLDIPDRTKFRDVVRSFMEKVKPNSVVFFYFAGHGVQIQGENYLLPTTIAPRNSADLEDDGLSLTYLLRSLAEARSAPNIVIIDACRDSPFPNRSIGGSAPSGLARVDPPLGTVLVYATAPGRTVRDGIGRNSLFAKHLVAYLPKPGLRLDDLFASVAQQVESEAKLSLKVEQVPYRSSSYNLPFCLGGCEVAPSVAQSEELNRLRDEAARRIQALTEENDRLKRDAETRASTVVALQNQIQQMEASLKNTADAQKIEEADRELKRLQSDLAIAQSRQREAEKAQATNTVRDTEIEQWKSRVLDLEKRQAQLDEAYQRQIEQIRRDSAQKSKEEIDRALVQRKDDAQPRPSFRPPPSF
jgi:uncharacterized caspase-like protein